MLRLYVAISMSIVLTSVVLIGLMHTVGNVQPMHPALRGFVDGCEGVPQPCWYGIVPTQLEANGGVLIDERFGAYNRGDTQFSARVVRFDFTALDDHLCDMTVYDAASAQDTIILSDCDNVQLGDVMSVVGEPQSLCADEDEIYLIFGDGHIRIGIKRAQFYQDRVIPHTEILNINLTDTPVLSSLKWQGFVEMWRYRDMEYPRCG